MLVLTRKLDEAIQIGDDIKITVLRVKGNTVRIGIEAPKSVKVIRDELEREITDPSRLVSGGHRPTNRIEAFVKETRNVVTSVVDSPAAAADNGSNDLGANGNSRVFVGKVNPATGQAQLSESQVADDAAADQAAPLRAFLKTARPWQIAG